MQLCDKGLQCLHVKQRWEEPAVPSQVALVATRAAGLCEQLPQAFRRRRRAYRLAWPAGAQWEPCQRAGRANWAPLRRSASVLHYSSRSLHVPGQ